MLTRLREADGGPIRGPRREYYYDNGRTIVVVAGRRSLKTQIAKRKMADWVMRPDKHYAYELPRRYMYLSTTQGQAERIALQDFQQLLTPKFGKWSKPNGIPTFKSRYGSELLIAGIDEPTRIEGTPVDGMACDEFQEWRPEAYEKTIAPMRIDRKAKLIVLGIPRYDGSNIDTLKTLFDQGIQGINYTKSYTWLSSDVVPESELELLRASMSPQQYRIEFQASWESAPGRAYPDYSTIRNARVCNFDSGLPLLIGCDFNRKHHNWGLYQYKDGVYYVLEDLYGMGATVEAMCVLLRDRVRQLSPNRIEFYGDYSGDQKRVEATSSAWRQIKSVFPDAFFGVRPQPPVSDRIELLNSFVYNAAAETRLFVHPNAVNHRNDLEKVTRVMAFAGEGGRDGELTHASSALGYTIWQHQGLIRLPVSPTEPILFF